MLEEREKTLVVKSGKWHQESMRVHRAVGAPSPWDKGDSRGETVLHKELHEE